ncbi:MAG: hypothetical protein JO129_04745 [Candidatus Dependentiae bacterium]|nr:hypothetical protein [Candidatus Dependentiae bacterium]
MNKSHFLIIFIIAMPIIISASKENNQKNYLSERIIHALMPVPCSNEMKRRRTSYQECLQYQKDNMLQSFMFNNEALIKDQELITMYRDVVLPSNINHDPNDVIVSKELDAKQYKRYKKRIRTITKENLKILKLIQGIEQIQEKARSKNSK